jgi:hypothetical protein
MQHARLRARIRVDAQRRRVLPRDVEAAGTRMMLAAPNALH